MNPGRKLLFGRDPRQVMRKPRLLSLIERGAQRVLVLMSDAVDLFQRCVPSVGQIERVRPAIGRTVAPFHQAALFQLVEQGHQPARKHAELLPSAC